MLCHRSPFLSLKLSPTLQSQAQDSWQAVPREVTRCCHRALMHFCTSKPAVFCLHDMQIHTFVWVDNFHKRFPVITHKVWHFRTRSCPVSAPEFFFIIIFLEDPRMAPTAHPDNNTTQTAPAHLKAKQHFMENKKSQILALCSWIFLIREAHAKHF